MGDNHYQGLRGNFWHYPNLFIPDLVLHYPIHLGFRILCMRGKIIYQNGKEKSLTYTRIRPALLITSKGELKKKKLYKNSYPTDSGRDD